MFQDSSREDWAMQQGLLGPTHWYMRHRDERAANRVLSTPRQQHIFKGIPNAAAIEVSNI